MKLFKRNKAHSTENDVGHQDSFKPEELNFIDINCTEPEDIFIAGYPKSGNTWMQQLIAGLLLAMDTKYLPDRLTQELVPDVHMKKYYKRFHDFTFFKSHDLPKPSYRRVIHLVRDGRDVMASYYAMNRAIGEQLTLSDMILDGKGIFPCKWHEHTRKWLDNPYKADILLIRYEDLILDPYSEISKIMDFTNLKRTESHIEAVIEGNNFEEMQRKEKQFGWNNQNWNPNQNFVRKGKVGTYKKEISKELIQFFENEAENELLSLGYKLSCK